ncbi:hypothetical protein B5F79_08640 [Olsenella sp. An285]|uniref:hypothetical protein n=1 Tax=Olsenella sp. An285 TaxID=1965621 RepID=UPI000B38BC36|nr:hypothetical protein [Olsenella sp. An285]OUO46004.1 hypothetical protein B5F79_08640 [Olsenella sp. An285]
MDLKTIEELVSKYELIDSKALSAMYAQNDREIKAAGLRDFCGIGARREYVDRRTLENRAIRRVLDRRKRASGAVR